MHCGIKYSNREMQGMDVQVVKLHSCSIKLSNSKDYFILIQLLMNRTKTAKQNCLRLKGLSPWKSSLYKAINGDLGKTLWWGLILRDLQSKICACFQSQTRMNKCQLIL